jgi:hypothetical protein
MGGRECGALLWIRPGGSYDLRVTKAELHRQIDAMTDEEAAEVKLIYAPDWPSKATLIEESVSERARPS